MEEEWRPIYEKGKLTIAHLVSCLQTCLTARVEKKIARRVRQKEKKELASTWVRKKNIFQKIKANE